MRTAGSNGANTERAIREAGLQLILRHGYEGMTLRQLAAEVGLQPGSLYNHFATKQQLLFELVNEHMTDLLAASREAIGGIGDPGEALAAFCAFHLRYHMSRKAEVFVINFELRSLDAENRARIVALRSDYEDQLVGVLRAGQGMGRFRPTDPQVTAYAIIGMLTHVCTWHQAGGRLSEAQIVELYADLVFGGVGRAGGETDRGSAT
jgi:AcrR family transcriptional regulator